MAKQKVSTATRAYFYLHPAFKPCKLKIHPSILRCFFLAASFALWYPSDAQTADVTLEKIWKTGEFAARTIYGIRSMNDGRHYTTAVSVGKHRAIVKYAYGTGLAMDTLFNTQGMSTVQGDPFKFSSYHFNSDESRLLLATDEESIYRHSSKAHFYTYNLSDRSLLPITQFDKGKQQQATFSPVANQVAFVRDNNLFIANLDAGTETQLTHDGAWAQIINGAVDWVYEEEFGFHEGFQWSPQGDRIAYYRFDEREVPEFHMAMYGNLYPTLYTYKYPKAGERNATVQIMVYDLPTGTTREVATGADPEQYLPRIAWTKNPGKLCIMRMNRHQNDLEFLLADANQRISGPIPVTTLYRETSATYIDINDNLIFLDGGKYFLWNSERDGWNHIYMYSMDGRQVAQLTRGAWEVSEFYGADERSQTVYFQAATRGPIHTGVYSLSYRDAMRTFEKTGRPAIPRGDNRSALQLLTPNEGSHSAAFSSAYTNFIHFESTASSPPNVSLRTSTGKLIRVLESNDALRKRLSNYTLSPKEFGTFTTRQGIELHYSIIKPANFDATRPYPMVLMIYGGPGSNKVANAWGGSDYFWHQMLAQNGYIVVSVDPRGTMHRGRDFKHSTYLQLGKLETEDFIETAVHFGKEPWVDASRIGIMGWSFGGYMSSLCMTKGADYFKLGIAVAPVTNWRYYDSIYTERFMRTPQENPSGYDDNSPIHFADNLKGHYLLVHGSADDNVHYQNAMEMIKALVNADKHFDLYIYPDKNHGIYGGNTRYHLYTKMTDFIRRNL